MNHFFARLLLSVFFGIIFLSCGTPIKGTFNGDRSPSSDSFQLRPYREVVLSNGLKVILIEDKSLPYFSLNLLVKSGASSDPVTGSGAAYMVGDLIDKGSKKRNALELADAMGDLGAELSVNVGQDFTFIYSSTLSIHRQALLQNFSEMVTQPSFAEAEVRRVQKQLLSSLQKSVDDPSDFAETMFESYLYGSHPYARRVMGRKRDVEKLRRKAIIKYYLSYYRPNNSQLAVVGQLGANIVEELEQAFKSWSGRETKRPTFNEISVTTGSQIQLINKPDLEQTQIRLGHLGIKRIDSDFLKLRVANLILGGAFHSRLVNEIRDRRGLTYSISSEFDARFETGPFMISTFTRHDKVGETVSETINALKAFKERGVSEKEVTDAKSLLLGMFPRGLETPEKLAHSLLVLRFYEIPDSYLTNYLNEVKNITAAEINEVIKKHFKPDSLKILVYSNADKVIDQLRPIAVVQTKSYKDYIQ